MVEPEISSYPPNPISCFLTFNHWDAFTFIAFQFADKPGYPNAAVNHHISLVKRSVLSHFCSSKSKLPPLRILNTVVCSPTSTTHSSWSSK